jgi:hypothetical protein
MIVIRRREWTGRTLEIEREAKKWLNKLVAEFGLPVASLDHAIMPPSGIHLGNVRINRFEVTG